MNWELRSINCYELVGYFGLQLARLCKNLVLRWRHLCRVPRTVTRVANRPIFPGTSRISGACLPSPGLGLPRTQNVPYFREAKVKIFWCDATPMHIKFHPESLKLMCMGREHWLLWRCVSVTIWSVKSELSSLKKIASRMHYKTLFQTPPHPTPRRLDRRSTPCDFGARFYASRIFSANCWQP